MIKVQEWEVRFSKALKTVQNWMMQQSIHQTTPEECYPVLVASGIYKLSARGALPFRNDLRSCRDAYHLPFIFGNLKIYQEIGKWHIDIHE
jgi:hypothetical protein